MSLSLSLCGRCFGSLYSSIKDIILRELKCIPHRGVGPLPYIVISLPKRLKVSLSHTFCGFTEFIIFVFVSCSQIWDHIFVCNLDSLMSHSPFWSLFMNMLIYIISFYSTAGNLFFFRITCFIAPSFIFIGFRFTFFKGKGTYKTEVGSIQRRRKRKMTRC